MRLVSLFAVLGLVTLSVGSIACGSQSADDAATGDPATSDGASEEVKAAVIDESFNNKTVSVPLGKSFTIALSQGVTGYVWSVTSIEAILGKPKETYTPGKSNRPGEPGLKKFTWSTKKSASDLVGAHTILLESARPSSNSAASTFKVTIEITDSSKAPSCGGITGQGCQPSEYCNFAASAGCGFGNQGGKCAARPEVCPAIVLPVCACNGKTYNNSCEANRAGVDVFVDGACAPGPDESPDDSGYECPSMTTINCMPPVPETRTKYCSGDYHDFIVANCDVSFSN